MGLKCKLAAKIDLKNPDGPKKWYGVPKSETPLDVKTLTRGATANSTTTPKELEAALELLANYITGQLLQGHTVKLPGIGNLRVSFRSKGVDNVQDFNVNEHIYDPRILFTPDKELRSKVVDNITFEDGGVKDGTINYATRADYYKAAGIVVSPSEPGGGNTGGGGGTGETPLG